MYNVGQISHIHNGPERKSFKGNNSNVLGGKRGSLIRLIIIGGLIIGTLHLLLEYLIVFDFLYKIPFISTLQYIASGALGSAVYKGGLASALLGLVFHYLIAFVIAAVFILGANKIPLLRRYAISASLLFGVAAFFVMNFIVMPLSAAPKVQFTSFSLIEAIIDHALTIGLPLGILIWRNAHAVHAADPIKLPSMP